MRRLTNDFLFLLSGLPAAAAWYALLLAGWLTAGLQQGKREKALKFSGAASEAARTLVGTLEGAMMIARSYGDAARFNAVTDRLLGDLRA